MVKARPSKAGEGLQLCVYVHDQPNLFSRICSFFGKLQFNIVEAKIYTTRHNYALDTFTVLDPDDARTAYRDLTGFIEYELAQRLAGRSPPDPVVTGRVSRRLKAFPLTPEVSISIPTTRARNSYSNWSPVTAPACWPGSPASWPARM